MEDDSEGWDPVKLAQAPSPPAPFTPFPAPLIPISPSPPLPSPPLPSPPPSRLSTLSRCQDK